MAVVVGFCILCGAARELCGIPAITEPNFFVASQKQEPPLPDVRAVCVHLRPLVAATTTTTRQ